MQIRPILSSLHRHKLTAILLALQVAFTCAVVCNAVFLIVQRVERVTAPSGLDENALSVVTVDDLGAGDDALALHRGDLAVLRRLPGVESAAMVSSVPFWNSQSQTGGCATLAETHAALKARSMQRPGCVNPDYYSVGPDALSTLGLQLVAGRDFRADEYLTPPHGKPVYELAVSDAIITRRMAQRLYPSKPGHAVGRVFYFGTGGFRQGQPTRIVGVVEHLQRANLSSDKPNDVAMLLPIRQGGERVHFALRSKPDNRQKVIKEAMAALAKRKPDREISADDGKTYAQIRAAHFSRDTTMIDLLLAAALGLLFVTALGIAGLASFWVGQRTRSIGIRRAIGATRGDILRYFQTENFLIVTGGVVLGVILAFVLNLLLMQHYELPRLPLWYLPVGAVLLWLLGQVSVLSPALRAARVPPVVATRSV